MIPRILVLCCVMSAVAPITSKAEDINKPTPVCTLTPFDGGEAFNLQKFNGKVVYVDFWASWCDSCAKSFPFLNKLHTSLKDKGLQIVGINLDEDSKAAETFLSNHPTQFTVAADTSKECATGFSVEAMPSTFIIDKKGTVRYAHMGFRDGETKDLEEKVAQLLAEQ